MKPQKKPPGNKQYNIHEDRKYKESNSKLNKD